MRTNLKIGTNLKRSALLIAALAAGCGSGKPPATIVPPSTAVIGLPAPATPGPVNTYTGAQSPGQWSLTLNNTSNTFSYQPVTYPATATSGNLQAGGGFSNLGAAGLAYEVPGQAAVLRPGASATTPVFTVPQTSCYAITGKVRFQYIDLFPGTLASVLGFGQPGNFDPLGYGSIVASTDSTGKTWQFENLQGNYLLTSPANPTFGPASFTATCAASGSQAAIAFPSSSLLANEWGPGPSGTYYPVPHPIDPTTQSYMWVGPTGFFAADQSIPGQSYQFGASVAGMIEPASALSTTALASAEYLGFAFEAPTAIAGTTLPASAALTSPVGFGQVVVGSGSTLTGGVFPNDAVAATPNSDTQITLGAENATYNGLYTSVKVTVLDPAQNCANFPGQANGFPLTGVTSGVNAQGYIICTFPGVAIAGNPGGNYAIFVSTYNWAASLGGVPEEFFLFQQQ